MISTLTSAIALSTASVIQVAGIQHSQVPQALFTITFLVGAVMFVMGRLRLGSVVNFVSNAVVILRARYQESVSSTALKWLERYASELRGSGNLLMLAGVESHVIQKLEKAGLMDQIGKENVFASGPVLEASLNEAFDAAEEWLKKKA
jgi:MFS superfamily sulfate permease-like transporter